MDKHKELPKINFIINNSPNKIIKETNRDVEANRTNLPEHTVPLNDS